jgi:hypothetical protein
MFSRVDVIKPRIFRGCVFDSMNTKDASSLPALNRASANSDVTLLLGDVAGICRAS